MGRRAGAGAGMRQQICGAACGGPAARRPCAPAGCGRAGLALGPSGPRPRPHPGPPGGPGGRRAGRPRRPVRPRTRPVVPRHGSRRRARPPRGAGDPSRRRAGDGARAAGPGAGEGDSLCPGRRPPYGGSFPKSGLATLWVVPRKGQKKVPENQRPGPRELVESFPSEVNMAGSKVRRQARWTEDPGPSGTWGPRRPGSPGRGGEGERPGPQAPGPGQGLPAPGRGPARRGPRETPLLGK